MLLNFCYLLVQSTYFLRITEEMAQLVPSVSQNHLHPTRSPNKFSFHYSICPTPSLPPPPPPIKFIFHCCKHNNPRFYIANYAQFWKCRVVQAQSTSPGYLVEAFVNNVTSYLGHEALVCNAVESLLPHVQTLSMFPKEELVSKVVMVRFDSTLLLSEEESGISSRSISNAIFTINYLREAGAKVVLVSDWNSKLLDIESVADILSSIVQCKVVTLKRISSDIQLKADVLLLQSLSQFKEEVANCSKFVELLSAGVDIFVNDSFSLSHKILASTVGITGFCSANIAGFHFEESIYQLKEAANTDRKPYFAIIGGGNLNDKAAALHFLASKCDGMVFVGMMAFQIMHALGLSVPLNLVEHRASKAAADFIQFAHDRNIPILYPKDFWCRNDGLSKQWKVFPAHDILDGWVPVDLGPRSLDEINSCIRNCKKIIWIGPVKFKFSSQHAKGASKLGQILGELSQSNNDITVVGNIACKEMLKQSRCPSVVHMINNASVVWEFLKGRNLPGVTALDRAYPFKIDWNAAYCNPAKPLLVDIGSGNGMFLLGMARHRKDLNFLGLEINGKLVKRCLDALHKSDIDNGYFIATNATSTFRSIVSSYPGELVLVSIQVESSMKYIITICGSIFSISLCCVCNLRRSFCPIQCPNPDFNKPDHRWRMLQRATIEAIADLLTEDGKVFLQSDIEAVALRMKEEFLKYGKGKLTLVHDHQWLEENPFGVRSDWERHVIDRGAPMYRLMLSKSAVVS